MATILKIDDGSNILEVTPAEEGIIQVWIGNADDDQSWNSVALDKEDTVNLIEYLKKYLEELQ